MPQRAYADFDLSIEPAASGGYRARVLDSPVGETRAIPIVLPFSDLEVENFLLRIGRPRRHGIRGLNSPEVAAIRDFGGKLFDAVFHGELRTVLRTSIDQVESADRGLRIRMRLTDCPELADLPWEYLYDQQARRFLALSQWTPIVRYLERQGRITPLPVHPPLRILVLAASPTDFERLDVEAEWSKLSNALNTLKLAGRVELSRVEGGTLANLRRQLRRGQYHVLHYIGHGGYDKQAQDGLLALEGPDGRAQPITGADFGALLHDHRNLRLAVLNSCEGARGGRTDPYAGAAQSLVYQGIPAVVAMQFEITDQAAITFTHALYEAVVDGLPLDAAMAEARNAVREEPNPVEWATPVLYLRAPDGRIFDVAKPNAAIQGTATASLSSPQPPAPQGQVVEEGPADVNEQQRPPPAAASPVGRSEPSPPPYTRTSLFGQSAVEAEFSHAGPVASVAFSPDSRQLASGGTDGAVRIWDRDRQERVLQHPDMVLEVIFSPDGTLLASAARDSTARVWQVATETELLRCSHIGELTIPRTCTIQFSPDGELFVSCGDDFAGELWDVRSVRPVAKLRHKDAVKCVAFSPDGSRIATAAFDSHVRVWGRSGNRLLVLPHKWLPYFTTNAVDFSPDGAYLVTAAKRIPGAATFWNATGQDVGHTGPHAPLDVVAFVRWSPNGALVATIAFTFGLTTTTPSNVCRLWRPVVGELVAELEHDDQVVVAEFSSSGRYICTASTDKTARVWDPHTGEQLARLDCPTNVNCVAWSTDETAVACATDSGVRLWRLAPGALT